MEVFRIEKKQFLPTTLEGIPGEKFSFRWNTKGHPVVYAAGSRSLALVEKMANIGMHYGGIPDPFVIAVIEISDQNFRTIEPRELPENWDALDEYVLQTQNIGDAFLDSEELALHVPSVIVQGEYNILLNPKVMKDKQIPIRIENIDSRLQWLSK